MKNFYKMVNFLYPDAIPGVDFRTAVRDDGRIEIDHWNEQKLGHQPELIQLHAAYMRSVNRRKLYIPSTDTTDPAPWLNEQKENHAPVPSSTEPTEKVLRATISGLPVVEFDPVSGNIQQKEFGKW